MRPIACDCGTKFPPAPSDLDLLAMVQHWRRGHVLRFDGPAPHPVDAQWERFTFKARLMRWKHQQAGAAR